MDKWQRRTFWLLWITYASFYLGRVNLSVALPGIMAEFGWSKVDVGIVGTALFWAYAIGQFVNGWLGDKLGAKIMVTAGLVGSAFANIFFKYQTSLFIMALIWAFNGYFQACGWGPIVKTLASWFPFGRQRGRAAGQLGTSYILGSAISVAVAGYAVSSFGGDWRVAFTVPGLALMGIAIFWCSTIKESPNAYDPAADPRADALPSVYKNWRVWVVGLALFCTNILRYGFLTWAPTYLFEVQGASISTAAYKSIVFPVTGAVGAILAGWLSDSVFKANRAIVAGLCLVLAGTLSFLFPMTTHWLLGLALLAGIGFAVFGAHPLLVAAAPMDYAGHRATSTATGFIDCLGYVGAGLTSVGTGFLVERWGWSAGFAFWVLAAFAGAGALVFLQQKRKESP